MTRRPPTIFCTTTRKPFWSIAGRKSSTCTSAIRPVLLICRSGNRSVDAGLALEAAGFTQVINVLEGFEGPLDDDYHRGTQGGWRFRGLPWYQT